MLPDTVTGSLLMTVVNMSVVFLVLGALAVVIEFTHRALSREGSQSRAGDLKSASNGSSRDASPVTTAQPMEQFTQGASAGTAGTPPELIHAVIAAALNAYLAGEPSPRAQTVFVRNLPDCGAWGRASRIQLMRYMPVGPARNEASRVDYSRFCRT